MAVRFEETHDLGVSLGPSDGEWRRARGDSEVLRCRLGRRIRARAQEHVDDAIFTRPRGHEKRRPPVPWRALSAAVRFEETHDLGVSLGPSDGEWR